MLMLLRLWQDLSSDLKGIDETWEAVFTDFKRAASIKELNILSNIQYFHECEKAAHDTPSGDPTTADTNNLPEAEE